MNTQTDYKGLVFGSNKLMHEANDIMMNIEATTYIYW